MTATSGSRTDEPTRSSSAECGRARRLAVGLWVCAVASAPAARGAENPLPGARTATLPIRDVAAETANVWDDATVERYGIGGGRLVVSRQRGGACAAVCVVVPGYRDADTFAAAGVERLGGVTSVVSGVAATVSCATLPARAIAAGLRLLEPRLHAERRSLGAVTSALEGPSTTSERRAASLALEGTSVRNGPAQADFVVTVTGDVATADVVATVEKLVGARATPAGDAEQPALVVNQSSERLSVMEEPAPAPRARFGWIAGAPDAESRAALDIAVRVLAGGPASRLHRDLVERRFLAHYVTAWSSLVPGGALVGVDFEISTRTTLDRARRFIDGAVRQLRLVGPSRGELRRARRRVELGALLEWEDATGRGRRLAEYEFVRGDARAWLEELRALGAITEESVRRAAHDTFVDSRRVTVERYPPRWPEDDPRLADYRVYIALSGESLTEVAERFGVTVQTLARANDLDPRYGLLAGQTLLVPPAR